LLVLDLYLCVKLSAIVLILKTKGHALVNYYMRLNLIMHLVIVMCMGHALVNCYGLYGSVFRIEFSYTDRVRHNSARIGSFSIFHKFVFIFVSGFTIFAFIFVFKCKCRKRLRGFSTVFIPSPIGQFKPPFQSFRFNL